jgi:hypothetical protein
MRILKYILVFLLLQKTMVSFAQGFAVNSTGVSANPSAILDIASANKGVLIPRIALTGSADNTTIAGAATSLLVYNTNSISDVTPGYYYWIGSAWLRVISGSANAWFVNGNSGLNESNNFIGTTDNVALILRVNNQKAGRIAPNGPVFLGYQAGNSNTALNNTGIGFQSLFSNTTGNNNTAVGASALLFNSSGNQNTATGTEAMYDHTSGSNNVANGYRALYTSQGNENIALGAFALNSNGADRNTVSGFEAMFSNSIGSNNVAGGYRALRQNTSGNQNVALGAEAMLFNTTGFFNTASGTAALYQNTSGWQNTASGYQALFFNMNGNDNTVMGFKAMYGITGTGNTAVGANTGGQVLRVINNCTFIGYNANGNAFNNATAIGANALVEADNSLVLGSAGVKVGIGTTTPANLLHILGSGDQIQLESFSGGSVGMLFTNTSIPAARFRSDTDGNGDFLEIEGYSQNFDSVGLILRQNMLGVGTMSPIEKLSVNGAAVNATGVWGVFSDARIKTVKSEFTDGLDVIKKIKPVKFVYNEKAPFQNHTEQIGIVAQDLEKLAPYMVTEKSYGDYKDLREVNNQAWVFLLINAVKQQQVQIEKLSEENARQKNQFEQQATEISRLKLAVFKSEK